MTASNYVLHWAIPSASVDSLIHIVGLTHDGRLCCTCRNWKFRHRRPDYEPCDHIAQAVAKMNMHHHKESDSP